MKPEHRREQILNAAAEIFAKKGYHAASVSDIIDAAGIARGTFYLYFQSKRDIFEELVDTLALRISNCLRRLDLSEGQPPWIEQLNSNVSRLMMTIRDAPELAQIIYSHARGLDEDFDQKISNFYEGLIRTSEGALKLGQEMGLVRTDIQTDLAAVHLVGSAKEILFHLSTKQDLGQSVEEVVSEVLSYTVDGLFIGESRPT